MTEQTNHPAPRVAAATELDAVCDVLAQAFRDDPVWRWLVPDDGRWQRGAPTIFRHATRPKVAAGTVWIAGDGVDSVAVWGEPGKKPSAIRDLLILPRLATIVWRQAVSGLKFEAAMKKARPTEPHWYLAILGTHPDHQGKGLGSSALGPMLDRCDADGVGAYLESSKEANIAYYRRHGFEVVEELRPVAHGPSIWPMWREPRPPES